MKSKIIILVLLAAGFSLSTSAQTLEVISAGGEYSESAGGSLSYTVGEVMIETYDGTANDLTQGFQQEEIFVLNVVSYNNDFDISVFPNPTTDLVNIRATTASVVQIFDTAGKLIHSQDVNEIDTIDMSVYERGLYQLVFINNNEQLKTIKVLVQ